MPIKQLPTIGQTDWGNSLNNYISQTTDNTNGGGINTWTNATTRPASLTADDKGRTGVNLDTGVIEQWNGTAWILLTKAGSGLVTVGSIFGDLPNLNPANTNRVFCSGYWDKDDSTAGIFEWNATSNLSQDGGYVIASKISTTGRWQRVIFSPKANINEFGAIGKKIIYNIDLSVTSQAPIVLLSSKFTSITNAQSWFPLGKIEALTESINSAAIQSAINSQKDILIPLGFYVLNKSLKYTSNLAIQGAGKGITALYFASPANNAWEPDKKGDLANTQFIYVRNFKLQGISHHGSAVGTNGTPITTTTSFDQTKSGFYLPKRLVDGSGNPTPNEANDGFPLMFDSNLKDLDFSYFAGDGMFVGNYFSSTLSNIVADGNKGFGIHTVSSIGCILEQCYPKTKNLKGGYWLENGGIVNGCNGIDTLNDIPWGIVGVPGSVNAAIVTFLNCNFEGTSRALDVHGDSSDLIFKNCSFQWHCTDVNNPVIRCFGAGNNIIFNDNCTFFATVISPKPGPNHFIWSFRNGCNINLIGKTPAFPIKFLCVDENGADFFGLGSVGFPILPMSVSTFTNETYGEYSALSKRIGAEKLLVGKSPLNNKSAVSLNSGTGLPTFSAPIGSIYLRQDGGANTTMYVKESGTGTTGWIAK